MITLIDNYFPWFGDMLDLGGNILLLIIVIAGLIWTLLAERVIYLLLVYPKHLSAAKDIWSGIDQQADWLSQHWRRLISSRLSKNLNRNIPIIKALIKLCPLLGLLGTVLGMLEVFDAVAVTGSNNPRSTASGVSKATVSTMAGMAVAISGLLFLSIIGRRIEAAREKLGETLTLNTTK